MRPQHPPAAEAGQRSTLTSKVANTLFDPRDENADFSMLADPRQDRPGNSGAFMTGKLLEKQIAIAGRHNPYMLYARALTAQYCSNLFSITRINSAHQHP